MNGRAVSRASMRIKRGVRISEGQIIRAMLYVSVPQVKSTRLTAQWEPQVFSIKDSYFSDNSSIPNITNRLETIYLCKSGCT